MTMISTNRVATHNNVAPRSSVFATLRRFHNVWCQRQVLKSLDSAALHDIGVTRAQAKGEAGRPIWDAPVGWQRPS